MKINPSTKDKWCMKPSKFSGLLNQLISLMKTRPLRHCPQVIFKKIIIKKEEDQQEEKFSYTLANKMLCTQIQCILNLCNIHFYTMSQLDSWCLLSQNACEHLHTSCVTNTQYHTRVHRLVTVVWSLDSTNPILPPRLRRRFTSWNPHLETNDWRAATVTLVTIRT